MIDPRAAATALAVAGVVGVLAPRVVEWIGGGRSAAAPLPRPSAGASGGGAKRPASPPAGGRAPRIQTHPDQSWYGRSWPANARRLAKPIPRAARVAAVAVQLRGWDEWLFTPCTDLDTGARYLVWQTWHSATVKADGSVVPGQYKGAATRLLE